MNRLGLGAAEDRAQAVRRLNDQAQRVRAIDRALAVVQRELDEEVSHARR